MLGRVAVMGGKDNAVCFLQGPWDLIFQQFSDGKLYGAQSAFISFHSEATVDWQTYKELLQSSSRGT